MAAQNVVLPGGTAKIGQDEYDIRINSSPVTLAGISNLPLRQVNGTTIYLHDVATVSDGSIPQTNIVRQDGHRGVLVTVLKSGNASTLSVVSGIRALLPRIALTVSPDLRMKPIGDQSIFVRASINGVVREAVIAAMLTGLMILLFLGSWRSTIIIAVSIPLSILTSVIVLGLIGQTINIMTLGGLALAVGILVDDATVTIENIERYLEDGHLLHDAILEGAAQISVPALVSTLCICIVFLPMFFLSGVSRYLFVPLAEAVVFAMLASYVLSRTLVPTMAMYLLKRHDHNAVPSNNILARFQRGFERRFEQVRSGYVGMLRRAVRSRMIFVPVFLLLCLCAFLLVPFLGQNFFPSSDTGSFILHLRAKSGTRIEETARLCDLIEQNIRKTVPADQVDNILDNIGLPYSTLNLQHATSGLIGPGDADILVSLRQDHRPTAEYVAALRQSLPRDFPGVTFYFLPSDIVTQILNFGLPAPIDVQFEGSDVADTRKVANTVLESASPCARPRRPAYPATGRLPCAHRRCRPHQGGTGRLHLARCWRQPAEPAEWKLAAHPHVLPQLQKRRQLQHGGRGAAVRHPIAERPAKCAAVVAEQPNSRKFWRTWPISAEAREMQTVNHYNIRRTLDIYGAVQGRDLGTVSTAIDKIVANNEKSLPRGTFVHVRGQIETMKSSYLGLIAGLAFAIVLVYLLIVVNFQSWLDPFIIITALPAALAGIVLFLFTTRTTLSVPALMGAIMCMGVATANSILVVSFAKERLQDHGDAVRAAIEAGAIRVPASLHDGACNDHRHGSHGARRRRGRRTECSAGTRRDRRPAVRDRRYADVRSCSLQSSARPAQTTAAFGKVRRSSHHGKGLEESHEY